MAYREDENNAIKLIGFKGRIWTIILMVGSCLAVILSMYMRNTSPSNKTIIGVQGRYMIPILAALPLFLQESYGKNKDNKVIVVMVALIVQIIAVLSVCRYMWND